MKHTDKAMKIYKNFLLNIALCSYFSDMYTTVLMMPLPLISSYGGCSLGPISNFFSFYNISPFLSLVIYMQLISMTGISLLLALLYRLATIYGKASVVAIPGLMIVISLILILVNSTKKGVQVISFAAFILSSLHTAANGIIMLLLIRTYREYLLEKLKKLYLFKKLVFV
uniref:Uncharacterized protein n=1 Tax=Ditylenchus dipsaci TaxID=166011 RepID=A0A915CLF1_9BILA